SLMLPYLEQQPLYNACNFSWTVEYGTGWNINFTVTFSKISSFMCPSDGLVGQSFLLNYEGSIGTTTAFNCGGLPGFAPPTPSTGLLAPLQTHNIANVPDGPSNTVAFSEELVPSTNMSDNSSNSWSGTPARVKWRDALDSASGYGAAYFLLDARTNVPA